MYDEKHTAPQGADMDHQASEGLEGDNQVEQYDQQHDEDPDINGTTATDEGPDEASEPSSELDQRQEDVSCPAFTLCACYLR